MPDKKLRAVKGGRVSIRKKPTAENLRRVVFIPRETGLIDCLDMQTLYPLRLLKPVEVSIEDSATAFERLID